MSLRSLPLLALVSCAAPNTLVQAPSVPEPGPSAAPELVDLGRRLFFDRRLSGDASTACASCHVPEHGFSDGRQTSEGYPGTEGFRNTPSLLGAAVRSSLFWDGRAADLSAAIEAELSSPAVMAMNPHLMVARLAQLPDYVDAFGGPPSQGATVAALAAFIQSLSPTDAPHDPGALTKEARAGQKLFEGKAGCVACHSGPQFTDGQPHDMGVSAVALNPAQQTTLRTLARLEGRDDFAGLRGDPLVPLTPSLRHLRHTAPYLHTGAAPDLRAVIDRYNAGIPGVLDPLGLSEAETAQLLAFVLSLSGTLPSVEAAQEGDYPVVLDWYPEPGVEPKALVVASRPAAPVQALAALPEVPIPEDNPQSEVKVRLGRMLYFDNRLSADEALSCATCHPPDSGWTDGSDICRGYPGTANWRNCPTVVNAAYYDGLFWDGRGPDLEAQAEGAATSPVEGNGHPHLMEERVRQVPEYRALFKEAFGRDVNIDDVWRAISAFERTIVQPDTPFDRYMRGDKGALSKSAKRGLALFSGKAGCLQCHNGPLLTDQRFHNTGAPDNAGFADNPLQQITFRFHHAARGVDAEVATASRTDLGRYYVSREDVDRNAFRTPSLRYAVHTPPYLHNGSLFTLEEVIEFYDQGGGPDRSQQLYGKATKSRLLKPLGLSAADKADLLAFLESLSGEPIVVQAPPLPATASLD